MIEVGSSLLDQNGDEIQVLELIGEGGQGRVFKVGHRQRLMALKWYFHRAEVDGLSWLEDQRQALKNYIVPKSPPDERFLWPLDYVECPGDPTFGYLMELRDDRFADLETLVMGRAKPPPSDHVLASAALSLADAFRALHFSGSCYKDINLGSAFLDTSSGEILICDLDNVRVDKTPGTIAFPGFAAPEVVRGESNCDTKTDLHSLAVLLFFIFMRGHPLEGASVAKLNVFNEAAKRRTYGSKPEFVFAKTGSNGPVSGIHDLLVANWKALPSYVRALFHQAFTTGLADPEARVSNIRWMRAMGKFRDSIYICRRCRREALYGKGSLGGDGMLPCGRCGARAAPPARIRVGESVVILNEGTELFSDHLERGPDFSRALGRVVRHPEGKRWGLQNLDSGEWSFETKGGEWRAVQAGGTVGIRDGLTIDFGRVRGVVRIG